MAIISRNKEGGTLRYGTNQFRYSMIHVLITFAVLLFLNIYCNNMSYRLFYQTKEASMDEKAQVAASAVAEQRVLNTDTAAAAVSQLDDLTVTRLIITDASGKCVYDSIEEVDAVGKYCLFPEIVQALEGNDVFTWRYHDGVMESQAATPILSYNNLIGSVYIMEYDTAQGKLVQSLQHNILTITLILSAVLLVFSVSFSTAFAHRLRKIMASMRIIREGGYSHKVELGGRDELSALGREFNDLTDKLQESEEKRRQFVSDASHELKTPLASIKLLSDSILQNDMDMETVREFVADIGDEADRLNRMSSKLLSLTRVSADNGADCEIVYMAPTIRRVVRMLSAIADHAAVSIRIEIEEDCSILILEDDLYQIIFNLVENGIKYNVPGGRLTIRLTRQGDNAVLTIRDTGVGIPEHALGHIFERFYRVDKARSRQSGGSGLGLAIVKEMVERNRGQIRVESTVGEHSGTTFILELPIFDVEEENP